METALFFEGGAGRLFGVLHRPAPGAPPGPGFVFCHPFGEEKLWAHRVFVSFARELAARGHPVLRFDYRGNGDSEGDFSSWSIEGALADIGRAIDELQAATGCPGVVLVGLRLGATLAALAAEWRHEVCAVVLWAPVTDGRQYAQELLRMNLATQLAVHRRIRMDREELVRSLREGRTVNVDGYDVTWSLYQELLDVRLGATARRPPVPCLVVQVGGTEKVRPDPALLELQSRYGDAAAFALAVEEPFWKEIPHFYDRAPDLFARTTAWLTRCRLPQCAR